MKPTMMGHATMFLLSGCVMLAAYYGPRERRPVDDPNEIGWNKYLRSFLAAPPPPPEPTCEHGRFLCALEELVTDAALWRRCAISLPIAFMLYSSYAIVVSKLFPRQVSARGSRPPVHGWRWDSDFGLCILGLIAGTPMVQLFHHASDTYGEASGMRLYTDPLKYGIGWAIAQVPIYLLLWDLTFYVLHRFILHHPTVYRFTHVNHHVYRPPTAWSGSKRCHPIAAHLACGHGFCPLATPTRSFAAC
jgi:hypothetical protein